MLAELAAANAAFAVIKEAINNGGDLLAAGSKLGEYFNLKSDISKKASSKGKSSEEFWAAEKLRKQEYQLKQMMIYQGRAGLWDDWLKFQAEQRQARAEEERRQYLKKQRIKKFIYDFFVVILVALLGVSGIGIFALMIWFLIQKGII
jgi:hypothetical protein